MILPTMDIPDVRVLSGATGIEFQNAWVLVIVSMWDTQHKSIGSWLLAQKNDGRQFGLEWEKWRIGGTSKNAPILGASN